MQAAKTDSISCEEFVRVSIDAMALNLATGTIVGTAMMRAQVSCVEWIVSTMVMLD